MEAGAHVWISEADGDEAWLLTEVARRDVDEIEVFEIANPENKIIRKALKGDEGGKYEGVELANATLTEDEKENDLDADLITLPHLNEPALLHAVGGRFYRGQIYTWTGPILIAVNPFQRLPLYTAEILESYRQDGLLRSQGLGDGESTLGPHVYAIADRSYRQMMAPPRKSQSVLISGESGAGKTESTKIVMLYLTTLGAGGSQQDSSSDGERSVMERVLQSNPVLEAFGNGKTLRNDNSSRFGKYIEMGFNRAGHLMGAKVETYLLEKVRVTTHASGERNYHIFYQLLRGGSNEQKKAWEFHEGLTQGLELPAYFHYTGQGGAPLLRGGQAREEKEFKETTEAMAGLGWSDATIAEILSIVAGILHLGQISFDEQEMDGVPDASVVSDRKALEIAAKLMNVDMGSLETALTEKVILARGTEIRTKLNPEKSVDARDAIGKTLYGAMFLWVVDQVNKSIGWKNDSDIRSSCGVLDIFGFECFSINSFEQLCINFTNEALQQQFNKFIFKMEQDEYEREHIQWAFIKFPDNQDCLDTIQIKKTGVLAMLDDECRVPGGNDKNYAKRMYTHYLPGKKQSVSDNTRFHATFVQQSKSIFSIRHFAGLVHYSANTGFMDKNKDEIPLTAKSMFEGAPSELIKGIYGVQKAQSEEMSGKAKKGKPARAKTVGQQFKEQLTNLIANVETTDPHYIRCLKPNDAAKALMLTRKRLTEQLRYGGVLEAVRVARLGYPVRLLHDRFYQRYRVILPTVSDSILPWAMEEGHEQDLCVKLVQLALKEGAKTAKLIEACGGKLDPREKDISRSEKIRRMQRQPEPIDFVESDVQLGTTKVFMRKPPHDILEAHRVFSQHASAILVQAWIRGMIQQRKYLIYADAAETIQRSYRGSKGRERFNKIQRDKAGLLLTNNLRMQLLRRSYNNKRRGTICFQGVYRGHATRRTLAATKLETFVRMTKHRFIYRKLNFAVLSLQCRQRVIMATAVLEKLMKEQKDMGSLKENNAKLKAEMASLKAMLAAQSQSAASSAEYSKEMHEKEEQIETLEKRIAKLEAEIEKEKELLKNLEDKLKKQTEVFEKEKTHMQQSHTHEMNILKEQTKSAKRHFVTPSSPSNLSMTPKAPRSASFSQLSSSTPRQSRSMSMCQTTPIKDSIVLPKMPTLPVRTTISNTPASSVPVHKAPSNSAPSNSTPADSAPVSSTPVHSAVTNLMHANYVSPEIVAEHKAHVARLEQELDTERRLRVEADGEIMKLREKIISGNKDGDTFSKIEEDMSDTESISTSIHNGSQRPTGIKATETPRPRENDTRVAPEVATALGKILPHDRNNRTPAEEKRNDGRNFLLKSPSEYLPMIRRGFSMTEKKEEQVVSVGWKVEVRSRKEREELLRDEVDRFEIKMKRFNSMLEEGIDVTMWQLSRKIELGGSEKDEFGLKSTAVTVKMHKRGDMYVQAVLNFALRGGYISKAIGRHRSSKAALEPLSLYDILEVKAGCSGYDHSQLPTSSKSSKAKKSKNDNKQASLFLTIKATPTPEASFRSYIFKFKSRAVRNDVLNGLRSILADMQIYEGVSISQIQDNSEDEEADKVMVPLGEVHKAINRERELYDRLLLLLLQGQEDLQEKEDELSHMGKKLDQVVRDSVDKDRVQANDSKLIMQLSKKLETLLMDNEDLRDQNDRLNSRLVSVECEKMNLMSG